ncbi:MAG: type II CAAX endopeptidase family protein [Bacteroidia bacterium]|nr:type II CAAX endopeptidase family protein [Bacteroidia bacterium]
MHRKSMWLLELAIIIGIFSITLQFILFLGSLSFLRLISGQIINFLIYASFLVFALTKIRQERRFNHHSIQFFFQQKILLKDLFIVLFLLLFSSLTYVSIMKIEVVHVFGIASLPFHGHLTSLHSWLLIALLTISFLTGVFAEELYFRGYLFELQYTYFKKYTWIINGFSWSVYHIFTPTNFLAMLPTCLMYSFIYQKRRNIWITIIAHLIGNAIVFYRVFESVLK